VPSDIEDTRRRVFRISKGDVMFKLVTGLLWLVVLVRFILPLPWPWTVKALLGLVLLIASQYH